MAAPTRRQRLREQTVEEIHAHALAQVAEGGAAAVSLNGIARAMGMSGPGLYRYYASRDDLLAALVSTGYAELAGALRDAAAGSADRPPAERLGVLAHAYRGWAVAHPRHYELLFGMRPHGMGADADDAVATIHGGMRVLIAAAAALAGEPAPSDGPLDAALSAWSRRRADPDGIPPAVLRVAVLAWTRLHGLVGLELTGAFGQMGVDPVLLVDHEVARLVAEARSGPPG